MSVVKHSASGTNPIGPIDTLDDAYLDFENILEVGFQNLNTFMTTNKFVYNKYIAYDVVDRTAMIDQLEKLGFIKTSSVVGKETFINTNSIDEVLFAKNGLNVTYNLVGVSKASDFHWENTYSSSDPVVIQKFRDHVSKITVQPDLTLIETRVSKVEDSVTILDQFTDNLEKRIEHEQEKVNTLETVVGIHEQDIVTIKNKLDI